MKGEAHQRCHRHRFELAPPKVGSDLQTLTALGVQISIKELRLSGKRFLRGKSTSKFRRVLLGTVQCGQIPKMDQQAAALDSYLSSCEAAIQHGDTEFALKICKWGPARRPLSLLPDFPALSLSSRG